MMRGVSMVLTVLILAVIAVWLVLALRYMNQKDANGQRIHACGHSCEHCSECCMKPISREIDNP